MTSKQKQLLLAFLGYYEGHLDGIFGPESQAATRAFQEDFGGLAVDGICGEETEKALKHSVAYGTMQKKEEADDSFWDVVANFSRKEFGCPCGRCGGFPTEPKEKLVLALQQIRDHFGKAVHISSGVRCRAHNDELPGSVPNSFHLVGTAADFRVEGENSYTVLEFVDTLPGVRYAYRIDETYVHMDFGEA
jgi:hypothetical protein